MNTLLEQKKEAGYFFHFRLILKSFFNVQNTNLLAQG